MRKRLSDFIKVNGLNCDIDKPTILLERRDKSVIGKISYSNLHMSISGTEINEISFDVYRETEPLFDSIIDLKIVRVIGYGCFEIKINKTCEDAVMKTVSGISLEAELAQSYLYELHINDDDYLNEAKDMDIYKQDFDNYGNLIPIKFYNPNDEKHSLLHLLLADKAPHWKYRTVTDYITEMNMGVEKKISSQKFQRTFTFDGTDILSAMSEIAQECNVIFYFDTLTREIDVYNKFELGEDTNVLINRRNLASSIQIDDLKDEVKNCFRVSGGDDVITNWISAINISGNYIYDYDYQFEDMPVDLVQAIKDYLKLKEDLSEDYYGGYDVYALLSEKTGTEAIPKYEADVQTYSDLPDATSNLGKYYYVVNDNKYYISNGSIWEVAGAFVRLCSAYDWQSYYEHTMAPVVTMKSTTAQNELAKLSSEFRSPTFKGVAVYNTDYSPTSFTGATNNVMAYCKLIVDSRYTIENIREPGTPSFNNGVWTGIIKCYKTSDETDNATMQFSVKITTNELEFAKQKIYKSLASNAVYDVDEYIREVAIDASYDSMYDYFIQYNLTQLNSFYDAYQACLAVLESYVNRQDSAVFMPIYNAYKLRVKVLFDCYNARKLDVTKYTELIERFTNEKNGIQFKADLKTYLDTYYINDEVQKIYDWGLMNYYHDILEEKIPTVYGNIDMDNRKLITWDYDLLEQNKEALKSYGLYDDYKQALDDGETVIDTVTGGSEYFEVDNYVLEIAYSPIVQADEPYYITKNDFKAYVNGLINTATKGLTNNEKDLIDKILELDDMKLLAGITDYYTGVDNTPKGYGAIDVGMLMHFAGKYGSIQLAGDWHNNYWNLFNAYRREDTYQNDNYISDGLSDGEILAKCRELLSVAQYNLSVACQLQHTLSVSLSNLLIMPEFKDLWQSFDIFNYIRVQDEDENEPMKLQIISVDLDFDSPENINVNFATNISGSGNILNDLESAISQSMSIGSSYTSTVQQASQGNDAKNTVSQWIKEGLSMAQTQIKNAVNEEVTINNYGILARSETDEGEYAPFQTKITGQGFYFTNNAWDTVATALGRIWVSDGQGSGSWKAGLIADTIIGRMVIGEELQMENSNKSFLFDKNGLRFSNNTTGDYIKMGYTDAYILQIGNDTAGDSLTYNNKSLVLTGTIHATGGTFSGNITATGTINGGTIIGSTISSGSINIGDGNFEVDNTGKVTANSGTFSGTINANSGTFSGSITSSASISGGTFTTSGYVKPSDLSVDVYSTTTISGGELTIYGDGETVGYISMMKSNGFPGMYVGAKYLLLEGAKQIILNSPTSDYIQVRSPSGTSYIATQSWVNGKHYLTSSALDGYAKKSDIPSVSSFLTESDLGDLSYGSIGYDSIGSTVNSHQAGFGAGGKLKAYSSSSRRYKHDICDLQEYDATKLYDLPIRQFIYNAGYVDPDDDWCNQIIPGFIAEEVNDLLPICAVHNSITGQIDDWHERAIIPLMLKLIQYQHKEIQELQNTTLLLQGEISILKQQIAEVINNVKN